MHDGVRRVRREPVGLRPGLRDDVQLDVVRPEGLDEAGDVAADAAEIVGDRRRVDQGTDVCGQKVERAPARIAIWFGQSKLAEFCRRSRRLPSRKDPNDVLPGTLVLQRAPLQSHQA
nr:hypothetical protein GCM10025699_46500 [Microbacterium flavescens]